MENFAYEDRILNHEVAIPINFLKMAFLSLRFQDSLFYFRLAD